MSFTNIHKYLAKQSQPTTSNPIESAAAIDIREMPGSTRRAFTTGPRVQIFTGERYITDIPLALFNATSTKPDLYDGTRVQLAPGLDTRGIVLLINYLKNVLNWSSDNLSMSSTGMDLPTTLSVTAAAINLGMDKYVAHIYRKCEAILRNQLPSYPTLDALSSFKIEHSRLLYVVASQNLAVKMRANEIPDAKNFKTYLATKNTVLADQIGLANKNHEKALEEEERDRMELAERTERAKRNQEKARMEEEAGWSEEKKARVKEEEEADKVYWELKEAEEECDEQSMQQKLALDENDPERKFTARERAHWRRTHSNRKFPPGC